MQSERPYFESRCELRDACYPPIAYCAIRALSNGNGSKWNLSSGEWRLVVSIALLQCLGVFLLVLRLPSLRDRIMAAIAVILSPALICSMLRGNPSGWTIFFVFVFLAWYRSDSPAKRIAAALALGMATSLKISPCVFGVLYVSDGLKAGWRFPWKEICIAALSAVALTFLPFHAFGGFSAVAQWMKNASANAAFYAADNPLWGFAAFANHIIDSKYMYLPCAVPFAWTTRILALLLVVLGVAAERIEHRLLYIGAAMAFITYHDYGGAYLIPAFIAWLRAGGDDGSAHGGVWLLLECVAWFLILTPLQIPNPCHDGSLNGMLQNEFLFVLIASTLISQWGGPLDLCSDSRQVVTPRGM